MRPVATPEDVTGLPPAAALIHQFVNTDDRRRFAVHGEPMRAADALITPAALRQWLQDHGLLLPGTALDQRHLHRAYALRGALRDAIGGVDGNGLLDISLQVKLRPGHGAELVSEADPVEAAFGHILIAAVRTTVDGTWRRLKVCPASDCQWVFYDQSRPGRARWCSPRLCGNRMKTRRYKQRRATTP